MAKGQMRSNKEKKKPKADHNKKQKGALPRAARPSPRSRRPGRSSTRLLMLESLQGVFRREIRGRP